MGRMVRRRRSEFWISGNDIDDEGRWEWAKTGHQEVSCVFFFTNTAKSIFSLTPLTLAGGGLGLGGGAV